MRLIQNLSAGFQMSPYALARISVILSIVLSIMSPHQLSAQALDSTSCYRVPLSQPLLWATSGAWVDGEQGTVLKIVDAYRKDIIQISQTGVVESTKSVGEDISGLNHQPEKPRRLTARGGEYWLLHASANVAYSDHELKSWSRDLRVDSLSFTKADRNDAGRLEAVYHFAPMASGFLAFGDLNIENEWQSAFVYFNSDGSGRQILDDEILTSETVRNYNVRDLAYLASTDDAGYILLFNPTPVILEFRTGYDGVRELDSFPEDFQSMPRLEDLKAWKEVLKLSKISLNFGPRKERVFYEILEEQPAIPVGLYARRGFIYLLGRRTTETEKHAPEWWLMKLNPLDGIELSRVPLPTAAVHLIVVPGDEFWAFIERQAVEAVGTFEAPYMRTDSMTLVPSSWIEEPSAVPLDIKSTACLNVSH